MMLDAFTEWAKKQGWNIVLSQDQTDLPDDVASRYQIPAQWYDFICRLKVCENQSATTWFLTPGDYFPQENGFQWNEIEHQSLACMENDSSIIAFWNRHLPIILSVAGDYAYYAINTENGNVVYGSEPEYEDPTVIAEDFYTFLRNVISGETAL